MSDSPAKDRLTKKIASGSGSGTPARKPGSAPATRNRFGDVLAPTRQTNNQDFARSPFTGKANPGGNPRAGQRFQTGTTKSGNVVHFYSNGERVVLNKKATGKFKRY